MRLIHLTDPHLTEPPPWSRLIGRSHYGKRFLGYASWSRNRRFKMRREWLDELQAEVRQREADQILLTGDLTQIGTLEEIRDAKLWLESLGRPDQIALVPGNHDVYAADSWPNLLAEWGAYLPAGGADGYPVIRRSSDVVLLGLSTAIPTPPISAAGVLGATQLERLTAGITEHEDAFRMLLLHHPPFPGMEKFRKRLRDGAGLARVLGRAPVDVVLYGHRHRNLSDERQATRTYCTASAATESAAFRQFDIESDAHGWRIRQTLVQRSAPGHFETREASEWRVSGRG